jgi:hypothetical protein
MGGARLSDPEEYLSRHRWRFLLESLLEGRNDWIERLDEALLWAKTHPDKADPAWETYSACERVSNLMVFLAVMPAKIRDDGRMTAVFDFLQESMIWIHQHIEYYGLQATNNHIVNNARALVLAGVAVRNDLSISAAMKIFGEFLPRLILSNGFLRERSSHYQLIVLNWILDAWKFMAAYRGETSEEARFLRSYAEKMALAAGMLCTDGKLQVLVGDVSPDHTPAQSLSRLSSLYSEAWPVQMAPRDGSELKDGWFRVSKGDELILGNFPEGAFPPDFPTHAHCDLTSFSWLHKGQEILVDPGRYRYSTDEASLLQKSASGHNLPVVDGFAPLSETLVANGLWWPYPYASAKLEATSCDNGIVLAHDGFARSTPVKRHSRKIMLERDGISVIDSFDGSGDVDIDLCWHFGKEFNDFSSAHMTVASSTTLEEIKLRFSGVSGEPNVTPISGAMPGSWISYAYGELQPALGISFGWRVALPAVITTHLELKLCAA